MSKTTEELYEEFYVDMAESIAESEMVINATELAPALFSLLQNRMRDVIHSLHQKEGQLNVVDMSTGAYLAGVNAGFFFREWLSKHPEGIKL